MRWRVTSVACALGLVASLLSAAGAAQSAPAEARQARKWCTANHWGEPRAIPDRGRQQRIARRALATDDPAYVVERAVPSHFGVLAVVGGDVAKARRELRGVAHIVAWHGHGSPDGRMSMVEYFLLEDLLRDVQRDLRGLRDLPGRGEEALWLRSGTIVVEWKAPVPGAVRALDGIRAGGGEVRVVARPYSRRDLRAASTRLLRFLDERDVEWSELSRCASGRGLSLGVPTSLDELPVTQAELDQAAGMRVLVKPGIGPLPTL